MDIDRSEQIESCISFIEEQIKTIRDPKLQSLCERVLDEKLFCLAPGSTSVTKHHCYEGGLAVHTSEVLENALAMTKAQQYKANKDVVITAVVWHDYGKIFDYTNERNEKGDYKTKSHYLLIKHLSRSYGEFMIAANEIGLSDELIEQVGHCILTHHGRKEWGSPIEPVTPEAFIVHAADHISAQCAKGYYVRK